LERVTYTGEEKWRDRREIEGFIRKANDVIQFRKLILIINWIDPLIQKDNVESTEHHHRFHCGKVTDILPRL
jgi:hypothetical protein